MSIVIKTTETACEGSCLNWIRAIDLPLEHDLSAMSGYLHQQGIQHRISAENESQVIWVLDAAHVDAIQDLAKRVALGEIQFERKESPETEDTGQTSASALAFGRFPLTLILIALSILGAVLVEWNRDLSIVRWLTFQEFAVNGRSMQFGNLQHTLASGQYWRLLTPIFLHFGLFHILFNSLWLWEFGRRLERFFGSVRFGGLVAFTGLASNLTQYFWESGSLFGGMSGVLYGLLGYLWIRHSRQPDPNLHLPKGLIIFMLAWLVLAATGAINVFIDGQVANAAHVGGLLSGMLAAYLATRDRP